MAGADFHGEVIRTGDETGGLKNAEDEVKDDVHEVDHEAGDGVGKSDENESGDDFGNGRLEGGNILGVDLHAEHDHKAVEDKDENKNKVGNVSEGTPNINNR